MAKKNWWFHLLKNIFTCESSTNSDKAKKKVWRWIFDKFRYKQLSDATTQEKSLIDAREEQRKHALNVAKATASAAEAALAAAQAAAEVVRLTNVSRCSLTQQLLEVHNLAAVKIQTAFRGYLARKALRALKGVVRMQAIARGRAVRRRISTTLKHLRPANQSEMMHSFKISSKNGAGAEIGIRNLSPRASSADFRERTKLECRSQRQWTNSFCSKEEIESIYSKKQDAASRRDRMKQYSFSHRERQYSRGLEETIPLRSIERHNCLRRQWTDEIENSKHTPLSFDSNARISDFGGHLRIKPRNLFAEACVEEATSSPYSYPRRSLSHMRSRNIGDDCQLLSSSIFPTYMAATESAKAKMRSMSTPRQRLRYLEAYTEQELSCNRSNKHHPWSSSNGESTASSTARWRTDCSLSKSLSTDNLHQ